MSRYSPDPGRYDDGGDQPPLPSREWDEPAGPDPNFRAAVFVWIAGAVTMLMSGCCAMTAMMLGTVSLEELERVAGQPMPPQFTQVQPMLAYVAIAVLVMGFVPGVIYLVLGFGIRRGKLLPIRLAMVLAITQSIVLACLLLWDLAQAITAGNPMALTVSVLLMGTPLALLGFALRWLFAAQQQAASAGRDEMDRLA
jgi:hypothetical protein